MSQPPRVEWDLLSHTRKPSYPGAAAPRHVEEKNPMSISETGLLKSLGGTLDLNLPTAKTTDSGADIRLYKKLNIRPKLEPCEKFARPITSSQEIGWGVVIPKD